VRSIVEPLLGREAFVARAIFFDKTPLTNWGVAWHQDLAIAVCRKIETEGFGPWSVKAGVPHAYAPAWVLERMLTIRLHLDDTLITNGALRVLPGSHCCGRISDEEIEEWRQTREAVICEVVKGGILAMRPQLLHSSQPSQQHQPGAHRRIIHLEFASGKLPNGLEWACT
jgi:ectoine hydroxylase-related dioxygenase (phytanoyl-CoA dioxygenase family)